MSEPRQFDFRAVLLTTTLLLLTRLDESVVKEHSYCGRLWITWTFNKMHLMAEALFILSRHMVKMRPGSHLRFFSTSKQKQKQNEQQMTHLHNLHFDDHSFFYN